LIDDLFIANKPEIEHIDEHIFKYHIDFDRIGITDNIGAICLSRPTNPTGNVLTDSEIERLMDIACANRIPLIIDNAYGAPFPGIIFTDVKAVWNEQTIFCMSLSKLGLPAARTGIIIAGKEIVSMVSKMNAIMSLAPGSMGAAITTDLIRTGRIINLSRDIIRPFYQQKAQTALKQVLDEFDGINFHIHKPEGAFFLWLWFPDLPITSRELYQRLKKRGVLIVPGYYFFPGIDDKWPHKTECIRINYSQDAETVFNGIKIIADEVKKAYM
jgi:valine--pyruvate aminotransferase